MLDKLRLFFIAIGFKTHIKKIVLNVFSSVSTDSESVFIPSEIAHVNHESVFHTSKTDWNSPNLLKNNNLTDYRHFRPNLPVGNGGAFYIIHYYTASYRVLRLPPVLGQAYILYDVAAK